MILPYFVNFLEKKEIRAIILLLPSQGSPLKETLRRILDVQDLDIKMLRLMRMKKERLKEIEQIEALRKELHLQLTEKEKELQELGTQVQIFEQKIQENLAKTKKLEAQQNFIKKIDEFNALTQEMTALERERVSVEQKISDLVDKRVVEEEFLLKIKESLQASEFNSLSLEEEIRRSIQLINVEGSSLKDERARLAQLANPEILQIYERLLRNKKDRVVVPIENRTCSGCHIALTAQHENIVRKGENLVFCEHCSRIHYWQLRRSSGGRSSGTVTSVVVALQQRENVFGKISNRCC